MADLQVLHVVPRWNNGGAAPSLVLEAEHARRNRWPVAHRVIALEPGGSLGLVRAALRAGLRVQPAPSPEAEAALLRAADVVVVHWWNTPSMRRFIDRRRGASLRWVLYSLVNGLHRPQRLPPALCANAGHVVLTSPHLRERLGAGRVSVVPSAAALPLPSFENTSPAERAVVHAGTLNVFKLSPHFVPLHAEVALPASPIQVAGSGGDEDRFQQEAASLGLADGFRWVGFHFDLPSFFAGATLLTHPVSPFSYASSDRVIQESQAAGVPVLVQRDAPVAHLVRDGLTGLLASDLGDFRRKLRACCRGEVQLPDRRAVHETARDDHDTARKFTTLHAIYRSVRESPATAFDDGFEALSDWIAYQVGPSADLAGARRPPLSALRDEALLSRHQRWACEGGLAQYLKAFPDEIERPLFADE